MYFKNKSMKKYLLKLFLLTIILPLVVFQNEGFALNTSYDKITLQNGVVVQGEIIGSRKNFNSTITLIGIDKKKANYEFSDINTVELFNGLYFEKINEISEKSLTQVLFNGVLSVYKLDNNYFIKNQNGEILKLQEPSAIEQRNLNLSVRSLGVISKLMEGDCNKTEEYLQKKFNLNDEFLVALFEEYHQCLGLVSQTHYYTTPIMKISPMIGAGISFQSNYGYDAAIGINYTMPNAPMFLIGVRFSEIRKLSERLSLDIQVGFSDSEQKLMVFFETNTRSFTAMQEYNIRSINIPISVNYNVFHRRNSAVFVGIGGNYRLNNMSTSLAVIDNFEKSTGYSFLENVEISSISGGNLSATAKIGAMMKIAGKSQLWLETSATNNANTQSIFISSHQSKQSKFIGNLTLGVTF